ncbi:MAG: hypothetical protein M4579_001756 [Chaenotheca gracillima]|nr:MAG: hypothetical protein M4579_001756 [Chaenotheca gracillima]
MAQPSGRESPPQAPSSTDSDTSSSLSSTGDNQWILRQRLSILANRIAQRDTVDDSTYDTISKALEKIDIACRGSDSQEIDAVSSSQGSDELEQSLPASSVDATPPATNHSNRNDPQVNDITTRFSKVIENLRYRYEELKHVHDITVVKFEKAAQKIIQLDSEVKRVEAELEADESEMTYLKLQLKALEIQALRYIPATDDEGLREGIERWKLDWADVSKRLDARREAHRNDS